jgi:hypothetical protein
MRGNYKIILVYGSVALELPQEADDVRVKDEA